MGSSGGFSMDPDGLYQLGGTTSDRSAGGGAAAKGLTTGLDSASGTIGHPVVKSALSSFVTDHVLDPATKLPVHITDAGTNVSNTAATARDGDNEGAANLSAPVSTTEGLGSRINQQV